MPAPTSLIALFNQLDYPIMWDLILYVTSMLTYILLFWFQKPKSTTSSTNAGPKEEPGYNRADTVSNRNEVFGDHDSRKESIRSRAKQRITSFRRRKALVEKDIMLNLGLNQDESGFEAFCDRFNDLEYIGGALTQAGFCPCDTIVGIDFSASNEWQGKRSFSRNCLHKTSGTKVVNPYQKVIQIIGKTLAFISTDHLIHCFGFGDTETTDKSLFSLSPDGTACTSYQQVIDSYTRAAKTAKLGGPTNFAPIINKAIKLCEDSGRYHILILIVDGQVSSSCEGETIDAIVDASNYPLSIIVVGVGDGPFGTMFEYDDGLPKRKFDNLQFVNFHRTVTKSKHEAAFALHALMEIPDQYRAIQQLGYLDTPIADSS